MVNETSNETSTEKDQKETHKKERQVCIRAEAVTVAFAFSDVTATDVRCCEKGAPPVLHANKNGKRQYRNTKKIHKQQYRQKKPRSARGRYRLKELVCVSTICVVNVYPYISVII